MFAKIQRIHFVGIGGIGMSGIAEVLLNLGYKVSGSDLRESQVTQRLASLGALIFIGHRAENVTGSETVVSSSAIARDNPEIQAARAHHIPVIPRAEMLAELMRLKYGIAIAGMHGKTTTTSMVAAVLAAGGLDPTVVVGGRVDAMGSNARLGKSQYLVAEADESDRSFLKLSPILSIVTNIDREHMDCYRDMEDVEQAFVDFMNRVPFYGAVIACIDNDRLRSLLPRLERRVITYGADQAADFRARVLDTNVEAEGSPRSRFEVLHRGKKTGEFDLHVPGYHNVLNATAAVAAGVGLDIPSEKIAEALAEFRGVDRRFQLKGKVGNVSVVDDYGHHPTEIRATLAAARQCGYSNIHVIFQPHRYTRTRDLADEFAGAFADADTLQLLDIYAANEEPIAGVNSQLLLEQIRSAGTKAEYAASFTDAARAASEAAQDGGLVLTLGAGSVYQIGPMVLQELRKKTSLATAK
ncbi:MAG TPA: UDP-N-acetylmuramate--L-alanine ligase [Terriglobales bacterium]|nr:UDP-N-acetylmuramate--L-alanine ligase [Terriglobales bacterium]